MHIHLYSVTRFFQHKSSLLQDLNINFLQRIVLKGFIISCWIRNGVTERAGGFSLRIGAPRHATRRPVTQSLAGGQ